MSPKKVGNARACGNQSEPCCILPQVRKCRRNCGAVGALHCAALSRLMMETTRKLAFMVTFRAHVNPLKRRGNYSVTSTDMKLVGYTGHWWVGCYIWYSEEGTGRGRSPPRTRNQEVAGSTDIRSIVSNLEWASCWPTVCSGQLNLLHSLEREMSSSSHILWATGWRRSVADWGDGVSASCTVGPIIR